MVYSEVTSHVEKSRAASRYAYDALGRRTVSQDAGGSPLRTLYDGFSFEVIREGETFTDGSFTTRYSEGIQWANNSGTEGSRYRWIGEGTERVKTRSLYEDGYGAAPGRYTGISVTLYGKGEAVAVSRSASEGSRGGAAYLGKDILGSVKTTTNEYGSLEDRYEYDAFGKPYQGDLTSGMNLGYTGKPYDTATGLYNYGYRDYAPEAARFTTVDPVRDGSNWFAYVNNDPVNWVDPWGLSASDAGIANDIRTALGTANYTTTLSALVNTGNLANIISSHTNLLDPTTANYVNGLTTSQLVSELNNVTVAVGVEKAPVLGMAANYGVTLPGDTAGLTVGNTVMIFDQLATDSNGRITELDDANLLAHEGAIHGLQYNARGSVEAFLNEYINDPAPYEGKALEKAAYNFGPSNPGAIRAGSLSTPILERDANKEWFK
jgi:RHS repeat-associated protein